jgi:hypothetical protein
VAVWKHWHVYPFFLSCRKMLRWSTQVRPPAFSLGSDNTAKLKKNWIVFSHELSPCHLILKTHFWVVWLATLTLCLLFPLI